MHSHSLVTMMYIDILISVTLKVLINVKKFLFNFIVKSIPKFPEVSKIRK